MADDKQNSDKRNSNLARIRDNQRRSRARRKEYLQELESKYRNCEQTGIEASAEIQAAARKVVEENRRLRHLLKQHCLSDAEIDSMSAHSAENSTANEVEGMLGVSKRCGGGVCGDSSESRTHSCSSVSPTVSAQQSESERQAQLLPFGSRPGITSQRTMSSRSPVPPRLSTLPIPSVSTDYSMAPYGDRFAWHDDLTTTHDFLASLSLPETAGSSSCSVAASTIRSILPNIGRELEEELGCGDCGDCGDGMDCTILNSYVFQAMDRYSDVT